MSQRIFVFAVLALAPVISWASAASAHHSLSGTYDPASTVELTGVVTKVAWVNPHVQLYVNAPDPETGEVLNWTVELGPPHRLQASGWGRGAVAAGDELSLRGAQARDGTRRMTGSTVTIPATGLRPGSSPD
jgi:hypothetical protein